MRTTIEVPQLGNTVEECLVTRWFKRKGDRVAEGDVVGEIETDKTTFEITSPIDGVVLEIYVEEGATAPVFSRLLAVGAAGETVGTGPGHHIAPLAPVTPTAPDAPSTPIAPVAPVSASPRARRAAAERGVDVNGLAGSGPGGRVIERDVLAAAGTAVSAPTPHGTALSPARLAISRP